MAIPKVLCHEPSVTISLATGPKSRQAANVTAKHGLRHALALNAIHLLFIFCFGFFYWYKCCWVNMLTGLLYSFNHGLFLH